MQSRKVRNGGFNAQRLWVSFLSDEVRPIEVASGLFFYVARGLYLVRYGYTNPGAEAFLISVGLNETLVGVLCFLVGVLHLYAAGTEYRWWRIWASIAGIAMALTVITAFFESEPEWYPVGMVWVSVLITECYLLLRHFLGPYHAHDT